MTDGARRPIEAKAKPLVGVIMAYVYKDTAPSLVHSHFRFQIRTFWTGLALWFVAGLCGLAYVLGGRSLWLPVVVHATLVFVCQVARLYGVYKGPAWLVGYEHWPQCGLIGSFYVLSAGLALAALV